MDLLDFFRGKHSWRKLSVILRQLPSWSRLTEARVNDEELAEEWAKLPESADSAPPPWSEYTPTVARLDAVVDRLGELIATLVAVQPGQKYKRPSPPKSPVTAVHRARQKARKSAFDSLLGEVAEAQERYAQKHN